MILEICIDAYSGELDLKCLRRIPALNARRALHSKSSINDFGSAIKGLGEENRDEKKGRDETEGKKKTKKRGGRSQVDIK